MSFLLALALFGSGEVPAPPARPALVSEAGFAVQVLALCNEARAGEGLAPLEADPGLDRVAQARSDDMASRGYFDHVDPDGHDPFWHLDQAGLAYMAAGENIAMGQETPREVVDGWLRSPGHRANILNPQFRRLGVGRAPARSNGYLWTQVFTN